MKKNSLLLFFFFLLLGFAYYLEEVDKPNKAISKIDSKKLISFTSEIKKIQFEKYELRKNENEWAILGSSYPANRNYIEEFISILKSLVVIAELPLSQQGDVFKQFKSQISFETDKNKYVFLIGDVSDITGNFYLKYDNKLYVVQDTSPFESIYKSELDLNIKRYLRFKNFLQSNSNQMRETRILLPLLQNEILSARIDSQSNRWYSLDLEKNTTIPVVPKFIKYKSVRALFRSAMEKVQMVRVYSDTDKKLLSELKSQVLLTLDKESVEIKLYKALKGKYGDFVTISNKKDIYEIKEVGSQLFYYPYQYFWLKKFDLPLHIYNVESFKFSLSLDQKKYYEFEVDDVKTFSFKSLSTAVKSFKKDYLNFIFNIIFNSNSFSEAEFINENVKKADFLEGNFVLSVRLFNKNFHIKIQDYDIEVLDEEAQLSYIFSKQNAQTKGINLQRIFTLGSE